MKALLLLRAMRRGRTAATAAAGLVPRLDGGAGAVVGCVEAEGEVEELDVRTVEPTAAAVASLARDVGAEAVVALEAPFHGLLADLPEAQVRIAWLLGPPEDGAPQAADQVAVASHFLRHELKLEEAAVAPPGGDHVPDPGPGALENPPPEGRPLRVGTILAPGTGDGAEADEDPREGAEPLAGLARRLRVSGEGFALSALVPEGAAGADLFEDAPVELRSAADAGGRLDYLRELDLFVSTDLRDASGLALLEAQAAGTATVAFDAGAGPEFCPLVAGGVADVVELARACRRDPELLFAHAAAAHRFAREGFGWDRTAGRLEAVAEDAWRRGGVGGALAAAGRAVGPTALRRAGYRAGRGLWGWTWRLLPDRLRPVRRWLAAHLFRAAHRLETEGPAALLSRLLGRETGRGEP